jgi:hypothetical protein
MSQLYIIKGQTTSYSISVTRNGAPVDLDIPGTELTFFAKRSTGDADEDAVLAGRIGLGITVTNADEGLADLVISGASTLSLGPLDLLLFYTLTLQAGHGDEVIDSGSIQVAIDTTPNLYVSIAEVRAEGVTDPPSDSQILATIKTWQQFIERATRQWFYPRELELWFDGTDGDALHFGVPIIAISALRINGDTNLLDSRYYRTYSGSSLDSYHNPRLKLVGSDWGDIYTAPLRDGRMMFRSGRQNQYIRGMFGYVEEDGGPPLLIKRALLKLVIEKLGRPVFQGDANPSPPPLIAGLLREEWTDGHRIKVEPSGGPLKVRAPGLAGITDDPEILGILRLYRAPIGIATPSNPSFR